MDTETALLRTIFLAPAALPALSTLDDIDCRVFPVTPLIRELILHGMKWGPRREAKDDAVTRFFTVCAELCAEQAWLDLPLWLPSAKSLEVERAMRSTLAQLDDDVSPAPVARAAGVSDRTLSRRFLEQLWGQSVQRSQKTPYLEAPK